MDTTTLGMNTTTLIVIAAAVILVLIILGVVLERKRRSARLRENFGPEYERVLLEKGDVRHAEAVLAEREKRVEQFSIRSLPRADRDRYAAEWANVQRRFVDDPALAVSEAETLVVMVMGARGYPMADFEQRAADVSVHHPSVVHNYRQARLIAVRQGQGQATTEELRQAMVYYRSLFEDLLEISKTEMKEAVQQRIA
jgi:hypothetical protein